MTGGAVNGFHMKSPTGTWYPVIFTPLAAPPSSTPVTVTSLAAGQTYTGTVPLTVQVDPTRSVPSSVTITLGQYTRTCTRVGTTNVWQATAWDTTKKLVDTSQDSPSNFYCAVKADAVIDGETFSTGTYFVYTGNYNYGTLANTGYQSSLAWAANYSGTYDQWKASNATTFGSEYGSLVDDPVFGAARKVVKATPRDDGSYGATKAPRFQSQSTGAFYEGHEFWVGFSIYIPTVNSSTYGSGGFPTVSLSTPGLTNKHIAIFQMYGPQATSPSDYPSPQVPTDIGYGRGAITIIDANRHSGDPADRFHIEANQLNGGDPTFLIDFPYNRGGWTDIVLGFHMSADVKRGWIEVHMNPYKGVTYSTVQPVDLFDIPGLHRLPRVTAWPQTSTPDVPPTTMNGVLVTGGSRRHRTDMQIYRSPTAYQEVTTYVTAHKIGGSVAAVDPKSYQL